MVLTIVAFFTGCNQVQIPTYNLSSTFNAEKAKELLVDGNNTIKGSALIRQSGGGVVTCAGNTVYLLPYTEYTKERIIALYGNDIKGFNHAGYGAKRLNFSPDSKEYLDLTKKTICDAQGFFKFNNITDGIFYVSTSIIWKIGYSMQGGALMEKITVKSGETKEIVLTPNY